MDTLIKERADEDGYGMLTRKEYDEYRHKRVICASAVNPDSKEVIPWHMRTSAFVPMNVPIICGILCTP